MTTRLTARCKLLRPRTRYRFRARQVAFRSAFTSRFRDCLDFVTDLGSATPQTAGRGQAGRKANLPAAST